jgi:hypothetical protein
MLHPRQPKETIPAVDYDDLRAGFTPSGHSSSTVIRREDDVSDLGGALNEGQQRHLHATKLGARAPMINLGRVDGRHIINL